MKENKLQAEQKPKGLKQDEVLVNSEVLESVNSNYFFSITVLCASHVEVC